MESLNNDADNHTSYCQKLKQLEDEVARLRQELESERKSSIETRLCLGQFHYMHGPRIGLGLVANNRSRPGLTIPRNDSSNLFGEDYNDNLLPATRPDDPPILINNTNLKLVTRPKPSMNTDLWTARSKSRGELGQTVVNKPNTVQESLVTSTRNLGIQMFSASGLRPRPSPVDSKLNAIRKERLQFYEEQLELIENSCNEELQLIELSKSKLTPLIQDSNWQGSATEQEPSGNCSPYFPASDRKREANSTWDYLGGYCPKFPEFKGRPKHPKLQNYNECDTEFLTRLTSNRSDTASSGRTVLAKPSIINIPTHHSSTPPNRPSFNTMGSSSKMQDDDNLSRPRPTLPTYDSEEEHFLRRGRPRSTKSSPAETNSSGVRHNYNDLKYEFDKCLRNEENASSSVAIEDQSSSTSACQSHSSDKGQNVSHSPVAEDEDWISKKSWTVDELMKYEAEVRQDLWNVYHDQVAILNSDILAPYRSHSATSNVINSLEEMPDDDNISTKKDPIK